MLTLTIRAPLCTERTMPAGDVDVVHGGAFPDLDDEQARGAAKAGDGTAGGRRSACDRGDERSVPARVVDGVSAGTDVVRRSDLARERRGGEIRAGVDDRDRRLCCGGENRGRNPIDAGRVPLPLIGAAGRSGDEAERQPRRVRRGAGRARRAATIPLTRRSESMKRVGSPDGLTSATRSAGMSWTSVAGWRTSAARSAADEA